MTNEHELLTLADQVVALGVRLAPDTVIMRATQILRQTVDEQSVRWESEWKDIADDDGSLPHGVWDYREILDGISRPVFDTMFVEGRYDLAKFDQELPHVKDFKESTVGVYLRRLDPDDLRWRLSFFYQVVALNDRAAINAAQYCLDVLFDEDGNVANYWPLMDEPDIKTVFAELASLGVPRDAIIPAMTYDVVAFPFRLMQALHNKATVEAVHLDRATRRRSQHYTGRTPSDHYVVYVDVSKTDRESDADRRLSGKARQHMVRGHFKTYDASAPLMGKHVGTFFWSPFTRGRGNPAAKRIYRIHTGEG